MMTLKVEEMRLVAGGEKCECAFKADLYGVVRQNEVMAVKELFFCWDMCCNDLGADEYIWEEYTTERTKVLCW